MIKTLHGESSYTHSVNVYLTLWYRCHRSYALFWSTPFGTDPGTSFSQKLMSQKFPKTKSYITWTIDNSLLTCTEQKQSFLAEHPNPRISTNACSQMFSHKTLFQKRKKEMWLMIQNISQFLHNGWNKDKTRHLKTSRWAEGNDNVHFSQFSDIVLTKLLINEFINEHVVLEGLDWTVNRL